MRSRCFGAPNLDAGSAPLAGRGLSRTMREDTSRQASSSHSSKPGVVATLGLAEAPLRSFDDGVRWLVNEPQGLTTGPAACTSTARSPRRKRLESSSGFLSGALKYRAECERDLVRADDSRQSSAPSRGHTCSNRDCQRRIWHAKRGAGLPLARPPCVERLSAERPRLGQPHALGSFPPSSSTRSGR